MGTCLRLIEVINKFIDNKDYSYNYYFTDIS